MNEFVPGYEAAAGTDRRAQGTPGEIVNKLSEAMKAALADPKARARLNELGVDPMPMTPDDFEKFIAAETDKWAKVIKTSGIKPE